MRHAACALAVAAALACLPPAAGAQMSERKLTAPPDYDSTAPRRAVPGVPVMPSEEERSLTDRAQRMHNLAYGLRSKADELRDDNHYDEAEDLDERADEYDARATGFERRAERERIGAKGPFKPAE